MNSSKETFYFLCSPSIGIIDNWLPVIKELKTKKNDLNFTIIIPKAGTVEQLTPDNPIIKISKIYFDEIIFKTHAGNWVKSDSFDFAFKYNTNTTATFISPRIDNKLRRLPLLSKLLSYSISTKLKKEKIALEKILLEGFNSTNQDYLLYDIQEHLKDYNSEIVDSFQNSKLFSISHGSHINAGPTKPRSISNRSKEQLYVYILSNEERGFYKQTFALTDDKLISTGFPRHNKDWIKQISESSEVESHWEDFVFIISRPASDYLPKHRKEKYLRDIKKLLIDERNLKVIAKRHPKEKDEGLFEKVFGINSKGKTWDESNDHPFILGQKCKFAISFFSGVALDMTYLNKPTIEYLNLDGINNYDSTDALRDDEGHAVLSYRYFKLVLGASNEKQFLNHINDIMDSEGHVLEKLQTRYNDCFSTSFSPLKLIAEDIINKINS